MPTPLRQCVFGKSPAGEGAASHAFYAMLDAVAIPHLPHSLDGFGSSFSSLFDGAARDDYGDIAPYRVEMKRHDRVWDWFESELFGQGCGILLAASCTLPDMKRTLKRFTSESRW